MSISKNRQVQNASISGGLSPGEAEELAELDLSTLEEGSYSPQEIPALGAHIERYGNNEENHSLPANDIESYVNQLLEDPGEIVPDWNVKGCEFEKLASHLKAKRDEYTIRTVYSLQDSIDQDIIDKTVNAIVDQPNYANHNSPTCDGGHLGLVLGQYLGELEEIVENQDIIQGAYDTIKDSSEANAAVAANIPISQLPDTVQENLYLGGDELSSDSITTRLRSMQGAGKCSGIEEGHDKSLLANQPTRNNTLVTLQDELVGSLKYDGDESLVALKDLTHNGRQVLQKGMAYRVSHQVLNDMEPERMEEGQGEYSDWEVVPLDRLELRPLRFAGESTQYTVEGFREQLETRRKELENQLELL